MSILTIVHVLISLIGIALGFVVIAGFLSGRLSAAVNLWFLVFTIATSVTGFFFPIHGVTPGIVIGIVSLILLAVAIYALRMKWANTYIVTASIAQFFNVLVLVVQSFQKISALHDLAPTGDEPIVKVFQGLAFGLIGALAVIAIRRGRYSIG